MRSLDSYDGFCLVLSGGGAKGVYHIGVWRALRELGVRVDAFVGASIGAIIAGFLAQGSDDALEEIGRTVGMDSMVSIPGHLLENGELKLDRDSLQAAKDFLAQALENRGLDSSPLRSLLASRLDEGMIRASGKDLGIVTVNSSELQPREVFIESMEEGRLLDYLMASAAFPGFEQPVIEGRKYIDGGLYDNIPYAMARKRGYRNIIISDISGMGRNRRPQIEGSATVYIKNSIDMGGVFDFDREFLDSFNRLGYLDTMRVFGALEGYSFFVKPDPAREAEFAAETLAGGFTMPPVPDHMRYDRRKLLVLLECAGTILGVERVAEYDYDGLARAIMERRSRCEQDMRDMESASKGGLSGLAPALLEVVRSRTFSECPYHYFRLAQESLPRRAQPITLRALEALHPELAAGIAWLEYMDGRS